jgi:chondroitin 4-sulfotransferase 11
MINHKHKCIFIHIPKTGGTSIESALGDWGLTPDNECELMGDTYRSQHHTLQSVKKSLRENYFKFAFVRNPWDRAVSSYCYYRDGGNKKSDSHLQELLPSDFKSFVAHKWNVIPKIARKDQFSHLEVDGKVELDFIGRFERIEYDYEYVSKKIRLTRKLPHVRISKHKHYTDYYDDKTRDIIAERYARDIEYFGYKFGE